MIKVFDNSCNAVCYILRENSSKSEQKISKKTVDKVAFCRWQRIGKKSPLGKQKRSAIPHSEGLIMKLQH